MNKLSIRDLELKNKRVLVRVDFNVPMKDGKITDDTRIQAALPTIRYILEQGGRPILMSHLGRPDGKRDMKYTLEPCGKQLEKLLGRPVSFAADCIGPEAEKNRPILLLENLRFYPAEEKPESDPSFAEKLAKLGDVYVNDAFGTAHRAHSSTATITRFFPGKAAAGFLLEQEIEFLGSHFANPKRPFYAIIGGAKVSSKIGVLSSLLSKVNALFIGGGMAYTFLKAQGISIGNSIHEDDFLGQAKKLLEEAKNKNVELYLPEDIVIANDFSETAQIKTIDCIEGIPDGWQGMDIGPKTARKWIEKMRSAQMIFWNGPLGVFEMAPFAKGTNEMAKALASLKAITIVGGGDSVAAINQLHLADRFTHISTGGGASLEYIEFGHLPGINALSDSVLKR